ncbi:hypothetical protein ACSBR1_016650 [Camellia fascicularis]
MRKRKHLYWTACSAHCIDLMLKDIANKKSVAKVIEDGKTITNFIYNSGWVLDLMRKFTGDRELIRPAITRFATNFIAIESIVRYKQQLRAMFNSDEWKNSRWGKAKAGQPYNVKKIILGKEFWQKATELCKVHEPLVRVLRLVDGDEKPTMVHDQTRRNVTLNSTEVFDGSKVISYQDLGQLKFKMYVSYIRRVEPSDQLIQQFMNWALADIKRVDVYISEGQENQNSQLSQLPIFLFYQYLNC